MTIEEKAKRYDKALDRAKEWLNIKEPFSDTCTCVVESIFPELQESEDERIRKELTDYIKKKFENSCSPTPSKNILANWISWLEKQGQKTYQTPQWMIDFLDENRVKFASLMENYDEQREAEGRLLAIIDWLEKQGQVKESAISQHDNTTCKENDDSLTSEDEKIRKDIIYFLSRNTFQFGEDIDKYKSWIAWLEKQKLPVGFYYVNSEGKKFYSDTFKYGNVTLHVEKQGNKPQGKSVLEATNEAKVDNANKVEPKFDVDDWVVRKDGKNFADGRKTVRITRFDGERYWFDSGTYLQAEDIRLWNISDAKAGDVLAFNDGHGNDCIELIKSITGKKIEFWFCLTNGNRYEVFDVILPYTNPTSRKGATPATKVQRNLLFSKMHEAGYEWDEKRLELKKRIE